MEELRAPPADRLALPLVNRRRIRAGGFRGMESGAVLPTDETRRTVPTSWQEGKRDECLHPFLHEKAPIGLVPYRPPKYTRLDTPMKFADPTIVPDLDEERRGQPHVERVKDLERRRRENRESRDDETRTGGDIAISRLLANP